MRSRKCREDTSGGKPHANRSGR